MCWFLKTIPGHEEYQSSLCPITPGALENVSEPFTEKFTEGPTTAKIGQEYLIYYDAYRKKKYGAAKTTDFITFTDVSDQTTLPEGHKHGTIFKVKEQIINQLITHNQNQQQ